MKIAVLSDIHGNYPALQTVAEDIEQWQPDLVVVDGDIINRGPLSADCLHFVQSKMRTHNWRAVQGNHEEFVIACGETEAIHEKLDFELRRFAYWTYQQLNGSHGEIELLKALPDKFSWFAKDGSEFRVVHASMKNNRDGIIKQSSDKKLLEQIAPVPSVFVTAHTHRAFIRRFNDSLVVNVGAVGSPFDGDRRASYGRFTWSRAGWQAELRRLNYDTAQTERDYVESGFLAEAGPLTQLMLVELRRAGGLLHRWAIRYQDAVVAGEIDIADSVRELLKDEDLQPYLGAPGWTL
ncbi:MAG: metallophosphoesterase [Chloroflexi bacterium]|nr:MAG: metallophosphoesterase [Chloroflexota bacterium]